MRLPRPALLSAGLWLVLLVGCNGTDETDVHRTRDGTLQLGSTVLADTVTRAVAPEDRPLVLQTIRGSVSLQGVDAPLARLQFVKRGRGATEAAATGVLRGIRITEEGTPEQFTYTGEQSAPSQSSMAVTGTVPFGTPIRIEDARGAVTLDGTAGPVTVQHRFGPVRVTQASGPVDVAVTNGDLSVSYLRLPPDASVSLRTENGDVAFALPPDASAQIEAETQVGAIQAQGLSLVDERLRPADAGASYTARLGAGDASVTLSTGNGTITLRRAAPPDTTRQRRSPAPPVRPDTVQPDTVQPDTIRPDTVRREATPPDTVRPDAVQPDTTLRRSRPPTDTSATPRVDM